MLALQKGKKVVLYSLIWNNIQDILIKNKIKLKLKLNYKMMFLYVFKRNRSIDR